MEKNGVSKKKLIKYIKAGKWAIGALETLCGEHVINGKILYNVEDSQSLRLKIEALIEHAVEFGWNNEHSGKRERGKRKTSSSRSGKSRAKKKAKRS